MKLARISNLLGILLVLVMLLMAGTPASAQTATRVIVLEPASGNVGARITVTGTGFNKSTSTEEKYAAIYFSSQEASTLDDIGSDVTTYERVKEGVWLDEKGGFQVTFTVPSVLDDGKVKAEVASGTYYVYICHYQTPTIIAPRIRAVAIFTVVQGELTLSPKKGTVGTLVEISGTDFPKRAELAFKYDGNTVPIESGNKRTSSAGGFVSVVRIPDSTAGSHSVTAIAATTALTSSFTVKPEIVISPSSGQPNASAAVKGTGFGSRARVSLWFHTAEVATATADELGSFSKSFIVPEFAIGQYTVDAEGENNVAKTRFTITAASLPVVPLPAPVIPSLSPVISLGSNSGHIGQATVVSGTAFNKDSVIAIKYDGKVVTTATADKDGFFTTSFSIPQSNRGEHLITVEDGTSAREVKFTVESIPPPAPRLVLPAMESKSQPPITFYWAGVTDDSLPITYDLQVASSAKFSNDSLLIEKKELVKNEYTISKSEYEKLIRSTSPYYWRVRAIDGAANEGHWTGHGVFSIAATLPSWALYTIMAVGGVFLFILGYLVRGRFGSLR